MPVDWKKILIALGMGGLGAIGDAQSAADRENVVKSSANRVNNMSTMLQNTMSGAGQNTDVANAQTGMINQLGTKFELPSYTNPYANNASFGQPDTDVNSAYKQAVMRGSMLSNTGNDALSMAMQNLKNRTAVRPKIGG